MALDGAQKAWWAEKEATTKQRQTEAMAEAEAGDSAPLPVASQPIMDTMA